MVQIIAFALVVGLGWPAASFGADAGVPQAVLTGCLPRRFLAEVVRVIDGDTITARILVPEWSLTSVQRLRLLGIDTPELKASSASERKRARMARAFVKSLIGPSRRIYVESPGCRRGYYGRPLVRAWTLDGKDIAQEIKRTGLEK